jgi:hypothetical protein
MKSTRHLKLFFPLSLMLAVILPVMAADDAHKVGKLISSFSAGNIRSLASADPDDVLAYLAEKIQGDAKKKGVTISGKESKALATAMDAFVMAGSKGKSKRVKTNTGSIYFSAYQTKDKHFLGVYLIKP